MISVINGSATKMVMVDERVAAGLNERQWQGAEERAHVAPLRLLRFAAVRGLTGLSRSTIWRLEHAGAFPRRIRISLNVVAWLENDVVAWIQAKADRLPDLSAVGRSRSGG
jgi:prophage regulatory protein